MKEIGAGMWPAAIGRAPGTHAEGAGAAAKPEFAAFCREMSDAFEAETFVLCSCWILDVFYAGLGETRDLPAVYNR